MNEANVDLDVLGALMLSRVCRHVDDANTVTKYGVARGRGDRVPQRELTDPYRLDNSVGDGVVLTFSTRVRHGVLAFGEPRHQVIAEEDTVA
jgi:hypothetical protein